MSDFVYREPGKVIRDILIHEMGLDAGQVMFTNQKFEIPTVGVYLTVSYVGPNKVIARDSYLVEDGQGGMVERNEIVMQHMVQIDIMAYNDPQGGNQARARKEEIQMALSSIYAQQQQEQYAMNLSRHVGTMLDTSFLEETEMMTRYTMTVITSSVNRKEKVTNEYYSDFSKAVPPTVVVNA